MNRNTLTLTLYGNRGDHQVAFPARWAICPACDGHATTTRHIECDGGGFTASEWADACGDDPDFAEDYFSGRYDRPCGDCDGKGRVQEVDGERIGNRWLKKLHDEYLRQERDSAEIDAIHAAERRMGA